MSTLRKLIFALLIVSIVVLVRADTSSPSSVQFDLTVTYATYVPGETVTYTISPTSVEVTYDSGDRATHRHLLRAPLTKDQADHLYGVLKTFPLDALRPSYSCSNIDDGFLFTFAIQIDGQPVKRVTMKNAWQPELRQLCLELNALLPEKLRLAVPEAGVNLPTDIDLEALDD